MADVFISRFDNNASSVFKQLLLVVVGKSFFSTFYPLEVKTANKEHTHKHEKNDMWS